MLILNIKIFQGLFGLLYKKCIRTFDGHEHPDIHPQGYLLLEIIFTKYAVRVSW